MDPSDPLQVDLVRIDGAEWVGLHFDSTKAANNVTDMQYFRSIVEELHWIPDTLCSDISTFKDVLDFVLCRKIVEGRNEGMILKNINVRDSRFKPGKL